MALAEEVAGPRDPRGQVGERPPRQRLVGAVEADAPEQRGAVGHGRAGIDRAQDIALEDRERVRVAALVQREHRLVPGEMAVEGGAPVVARHPLVEERGPRVDVEGLELDVGQVVRRARVARVLLERGLRQPARLLEPVHLMVGEGERRLEPPVVPVRGRQPLEEGHPVLLAIAAAGQGDGAARLVDQHRVAREVLHVLVHQREAARGLAGHEGARRLHVLALAPGRAGHGLARAARGGARRCGIALHRGQERSPHVRHREAVVGRERRREALLGAGAVGQQPVHPVLELREGRG